MEKLSRELMRFVEGNGEEVMKEFNKIVNSYNPVVPLRIVELEMREVRGNGKVVYEDDECIIIMM